jgi:hypothetical protein
MRRIEQANKFELVLNVKPSVLLFRERNWFADKMIALSADVRFRG